MIISHICTPLTFISHRYCSGSFDPAVKMEAKRGLKGQILFVQLPPVTLNRIKHQKTSESENL